MGRMSGAGLRPPPRLAVALIVSGGMLLAASGGARATMGRVAPVTSHLLEFELLDRPREVILSNPLGTSRPVWTVTYRIRNPEPVAREVTLDMFFEIDVQGRDDRPVRVRAGDDVGARREIEYRNRREYLDHTAASGRLRPGQVKECVAAFERIDPEADFIDLYVLGLTPVERREHGDPDHPLPQTAGAYYRKLLQSGVDVRRHVRGEDGRHEFVPVLTEIDALTYERLHDEELQAAQILLHEDLSRAVEIRSSDLLEVTHDRPDARRGVTYYRMSDPMLNQERGVFRETWVRMLRYVRRGDAFYVDADVTSRAEAVWLLAVEPSEDPGS